MPISTHYRPAKSHHTPQVSHRFTCDQQSLHAALSELVAAMPHRFCEAEGACPALRFEAVEQGERRLRICRADGQIVVRYPSFGSALRALGLVLGRLESGLNVAYEETCSFESLGVMLDVSRNGVMRVPSVFKLIRHLALMGINQLMLYTEDTYEVPGEPVFGYFRGRYTQEELREIDAYAEKFSIEVVPCIQTLGHLEQVLKWPCYRHMQDTKSVLLSGEDDTNTFVDKMIAAATAPFRSKRIHIGMDEAEGIGSGIYRLKNGLRPPFEVLNDHLSRTTESCHRLGLQPMIWSDMFFRLGSKVADYYDYDAVISEEIIARVPEGVDFVYWDYYHTDTEFYREWIARHRRMGKEPIYAAGVWAWNRLWTQLRHSMSTLRAGMTAAREEGLKEAVVTVWGDDGTETDMFTALPGIQFFAEMAHAAAEQAEENLSAHFLGSSEGDVDAWIDASNMDMVPCGEDPSTFYQANPSKWILWHDPLLSFLDQHIKSEFVEHFERLSARCEEASQRGGENFRLGYAARITRVLALKSHLHSILRPAYKAGDRQALRDLFEQTLPALQQEVQELREFHEELWHEIYRPFGWEVLERRYAGLLSRLETLGKKLSAHLAAPSCPIHELDCETTEIWPEGRFLKTTFRHMHVSSASSISS